MCEINNSLYGINSRWDTVEEKINPFEGIATETLQKEIHWRKMITERIESVSWRQLQEA